MSPRGFHLILSLILIGNIALPVLAEEAEYADESEQIAGDEAVARPSIYVEMTPPFIANAGASVGRQSFVKAQVTLRVSSEAAQTAVVNHSPRLRHEMVMLLAARDRETLSSPPGQEALQKAALKQFNEVLAQEQTEAQVDDVLFTSFVVQR